MLRPASDTAAAGGHRQMLASAQSTYKFRWPGSLRSLRTERSCLFLLLVESLLLAAPSLEMNAIAVQVTQLMRKNESSGLSHDKAVPPRRRGQTKITQIFVKITIFVNDPRKRRSGLRCPGQEVCRAANQSQILQ